MTRLRADSQNFLKKKKKCCWQKKEKVDFSHFWDVSWWSDLRFVFVCGSFAHSQNQWFCTNKWPPPVPHYECANHKSKRTWLTCRNCFWIMRIWLFFFYLFLILFPTLIHPALNPCLLFYQNVIVVWPFTESVASCAPGEQKSPLRGLP